MTLGTQSFTVSQAGTSNITTSTVWDTSQSPFVIPNGGVLIGSGGSLTIAPGVVVKFAKFAPNQNTAYLRVLSGGSLTANGTVAQPIYFTSLLDDAIGGDSNGDGTATTPAVGDWSGIRFDPGATGAVSNAAVRYRGGNGCCGPQYAGLDIATGAANQPVLGAGIQITDEVTGIAVSGTGTNQIGRAHV